MDWGIYFSFILISSLAVVVMVPRWVDRWLQAQAQSRGGVELVDYLTKNILASGRAVELSGQGAEVVPSYKFFSRLVEQLNYYTQKMGVINREAFRNIRKGVLSDCQQEQRASSVNRGCWAQYGLICLFVWGFYGVMLSSGFGALGFWKWSLLLQLLGAGSHWYWQRWYYRRLFRDFELVFQTIYRLGVLLRVEISVGEKIELSGVGNLPLGVNPVLQICVTRARDLVSEYRQSGVAPVEELQILQGETWFQYERCAERYFQWLAVLRFIHLFVFFLSSFLVMIWGVMISSIGQL